MQIYDLDKQLFLMRLHNTDEYVNTFFQGKFN